MSQQHSETLDELLRRSADTASSPSSPAYEAEEEYELPENPYERQMLDAVDAPSPSPARKAPKGKKKQAKKDVPYDDEEVAKKMTWREFLNGSVWGGSWLRNNVRYLGFVVLLTLVYVGNGYFVSERRIEGKQLRDTLEDRRLRELTLSSELTKRTRVSTVEKALQDTSFSLPKENVYTLPIAPLNE